MFKQDLENTEPSEIKFSTSMAHRKSKGIPKSIYFCFIDYTKASDYVDHNKLLKNFPEFVVIHIVRGFSVVNKAEVDALWNSLAFSMSHGC